MHLLEISDHEMTKRLGVKLLAEQGRARDVREHHGHDPARLAPDRSLRGHGRPARTATLRRSDVRRTAASTCPGGHAASASVHRRLRTPQHTIPGSGPDGNSIRPALRPCHPGARERLHEEPAMLPLTGERTVPGIARENYWFRRHLAVYEALAPRCPGVVLEAGCGEGYGADLLAGGATRVLALDYDAAAIGHVGRRYPRVTAARANLVALPVRAGGVDAVVSLQVV